MRSIILNLKKSRILRAIVGGNLYIFDNSGILYFYDREINGFRAFSFSTAFQGRALQSFLIDRDDRIYITHQGVIERYYLDLSVPGEGTIKRYADFDHCCPVESTFYTREGLVFIDEKGDLYRIGKGENSLYMRNLADIIRENGDISSIIFDGEDLLIAFRTNGLIRLDAKNGYTSERMDINCGVFSLWKDEEQDIVWIGTDGQGIYACTKDDYIFKGINLKELPVKKERPVRAIHTDHLGALWLGTKENGIIRVRQYEDLSDYSLQHVDHFTINDGLCNDAVFAFCRSEANNVLWIGSNGPELNYYSYYDKKIHTLENPTSNRFPEVHALLEASASALWVASLNSLIRVDLEKRGSGMQVRDTELYSFSVANNRYYNQVYSLCQESDSIMWVGIRGNGVIRLNTETKEYRIITFSDHGIAPMNDILCIHQDRNGTLWLGSSYGIIRLKYYPGGGFDYRNYNENDGLLNNTIHGILETSDGKLWLSSNTGLTLFDPEKESFRNFNHRTGLKTIEFSDNAYYKDVRRGVYFFGGVDGIVWIRHEDTPGKQFVPGILFTDIRIFNESFPLNNFVKNGNKEDYIQLTHKENFFTVSFISNDFINGENGNYSYQLENFSDVWMNTRSCEAQFTNIPPGEYFLKVRYNNGVNNLEGPAGVIRIVILPPWYLTIYARIFYTLLTLGFVFLSFSYARSRYERKKRKIARELDRKYKDEMYEEKLRFFTNITHEFCTPLTLMYGPSERILNYEKSDPFIRKYARIIRSNAERLNHLIQEIIDFRRMETGNKICHVEKCDMDEILQDILSSFTRLAEEHTIRFETDITSGLTWNTDYSCFTKIVNSLISNAFKYTPVGGTIRVSLQVHNNELLFKVYNTGKGITPENIPLIFNRYSVLDNIEENTVKGLSSRNGLGLAICRSMTELLQGEIRVESQVGEYAEFIVTLPCLHTERAETAAPAQPKTSIQTLAIPISEPAPGAGSGKVSASGDKKDLPRILLIDDNQELLWMLEEMLADEYEITMAGDGEAGFRLMKQSVPDLIITDVMMPKMDGISLTRQIRENKHTMHIPLVILSARTSTDEKIEGIESGADAYIPKPFDPQYLKTIVRHLLENKKRLKEYYTTSASLYEFTGGQLLKTEDKAFYERITEILEEHLDNAEFTPERLAEEQGVSLRNLYSRFTEKELHPPRDFIKEQRVQYAAKLLLTTRITIQEVMYKTGFSTRSHFYKEFSKKYNQSPKEYRDSNNPSAKDIS